MLAQHDVWSDTLAAFMVPLATTECHYVHVGNQILCAVRSDFNEHELMYRLSHVLPQGLALAYSMQNVSQLALA